MEYVVGVLAILQAGCIGAVVWIWHDFKALKSNIRRGQEAIQNHAQDGNAKCDYCDLIVARHRTRGGSTACANCYHKQGV